MRIYRVDCGTSDEREWTFEVYAPNNNPQTLLRLLRKTDQGDQIVKIVRAVPLPDKARVLRRLSYR